MQIDFLGEKILSKTGEIKVEDALSSNPVIALYFSAKWCSACEQFTPVLVELYQKWNKKSKKIEILFFSRDQDETSFTEYYKEMPWLAIHFANKELIITLKNKYRVVGLPTLVIIDKNGNCLSPDAREEIDVYGEQALAHLKALYE